MWWIPLHSAQERPKLRKAGRHMSLFVQLFPDTFTPSILALHEQSKSPSRTRKESVVQSPPHPNPSQAGSPLLGTEAGARCPPQGPGCPAERVFLSVGWGGCAPSCPQGGADLGLWDMADEVLSDEVRLCGLSECCPSMMGRGVEDSQNPVSALCSYPAGQPCLWALSLLCPG